jgi:hypothetical protein
MEINLPSRTDAIIPQPQEQKLQDVVNSFILKSFSSSVLASTARRSMRLAIARPAQPPPVVLNHSRREVFEDGLGSMIILPNLPIELHDPSHCRGLRFQHVRRLATHPHGERGRPHTANIKQPRRLFDSVRFEFSLRAEARPKVGA